ncbi:MAG: pyridoxal phosphate-dependent aminotransferase [Bacteroidales bacterium]|nr:pyridoxal phosphate-dependent aminotransferase [Bacteroidales bacterium]MDY6000691.1 pyridoxal phosphate-dependent aminotransferase [Candidatus Cryptobacteroides sp.]
MASISKKTQLMPASAIRKLVPFADEAKSKGVKVFHLNVGAPDIKSPKCVLDAVRNNDLDHVSYSNSAGMMELRKAFAEKYYRKVGINIDPSEIIVTTGGSEGIDIALQIACDEGDELLVMEPFYTNYYTFCYLNNINLKVVHTDISTGFIVPSIDEFEKLVSPRTKAVLVSNPGNPTGTLYSKEDMMVLGNFCKKHDLFLISDEVYREFCYSGEPHFSAMNIPGLEQNVILLDSVSKRYNLCGVRIGCIISHNKDVIAAALKFGQSRLCAPVYGQIATLGAMDTPDSYFETTKKEYIARRDYALGRLNAMEGVYSPVPGGAFYTIAEIPVDNAENFCKWMLTDFSYNGMTTMVTPAQSFYRTPGCGISHIRLAYVLEVPELEKAMDALEAGLKAYPGRTI